MIALLCGVLACSVIDHANTRTSDDMRFTDVTIQSGVSGVLTSGSTPSTQVLEVKGGGLALIDFDNDGDLDLFVPNGATLADPNAGPGARLYRNDLISSDASAASALHFTDVTTQSGITHRRWSFGATVGDVDGDGFDDIFIACFGPDVLLRNKGDGTFEDITQRAGVADPRWGTSAAFADLDRDGDLDLYVCNYLDFDPARPLAPANFKGVSVVAGPRGYPAAVDSLYENRGDGTFIDRSDDSGIRRVSPGFGLNLAILDFTGDGKQDIYIANDSQANNLFRATGESALSFVDDGMRSGSAVNGEGSEQASMGVAIADVDGNGRPDIFSTNFSSDTNTLHLNLDGKSFDDRTNQFGLGAPSRPLVGWGAGFFDFDHDADEDVLIVNGHVYPQATKELMDSEYAQRPLLMERRGARFFPLTQAGEWKLEPHVDRTAVFADLDHDGDVDFVIAGLNQPLRVIRNDHASAIDDPRKDWLVVIPRDLRKGVGNRHAIGAEIRVQQGSRVQRRWMVGGGPFQSNNAPEVHFGLGGGEVAPVAADDNQTATAEKIDVEVIFSDGVKVQLHDVAPGTRLFVDHP